MGLRIRRSLKVAPGLRLTFSPSGVSTSLGVTGARVTVGSTGRVTRTLGIPGTGISNVETVGHIGRQSSSGARSGGGSGRGVTPEEVPEHVEIDRLPLHLLPEPGLFAPRAEKEFHSAMAKNTPTAYDQVAAEHPEAYVPATLLATLTLLREGEEEPALARAKNLWDYGAFTRPEPLIDKYLFWLLFQVGIAEGVSATLSVSREGLALLYAELLQSNQQREEALAVLDSVERSSTVLLSTVELLAELGRWQELISLTDGISNTDDGSALLLAYRGMAFRNEGLPEAAIEALKLALRATSRTQSVRTFAYLERARAYLALGQKAKAKADVGKIMAVTSDDPRVSQLLQEIGD